MFNLLLGLVAVVAVGAHLAALVGRSGLAKFDLPTGLLASVLLSLLSLAVVLELSRPRESSAPPLGSIPGGGLLLRLVPALAFIVVAGSVALLLLRMSYRTCPRDRLLLAAVPYFAAWAFSVLLGRFPGATASAWLAWGAALATLAAPLDAHRKRQFARLLVWSVVLLSLVAAVKFPSWAYAPYQLWPGGWRTGEPRLQGVMPQPNPLGWIAAFGICIELLREGRLLWRVAMCVPPAICLALSGSR